MFFLAPDETVSKLIDALEYGGDINSLSATLPRHYQQCLAMWLSAFHGAVHMRTAEQLCAQVTRFCEEALAEATKER